MSSGSLVLFDQVFYHLLVDEPNNGAIAISIRSLPFRFQNTFEAKGRTWTVTTIAIEAFPAAVSHIFVPRTVTEIFPCSFHGAPDLTAIWFEDESRLRVLAGFNQTGICELTVPHQVEIIDHDAFRGSSHLSSIQFAPEGCLREIRGFQGCPIPDVWIPRSVVVIGSCAFRDCRNLRAITFYHGSQLGILRGFQGTGVEAISIPSGVTSIAPTGFLNCRDLRFVRFQAANALPASVTCLARRHSRLFIEYHVVHLRYSRRLVHPPTRTVVPNDRRFIFVPDNSCERCILFESNPIREDCKIAAIEEDTEEKIQETEEEIQDAGEIEEDIQEIEEEDEDISESEEEIQETGEELQEPQEIEEGQRLRQDRNWVSSFKNLPVLSPSDEFASSLTVEFRLSRTGGELSIREAGHPAHFSPYNRTSRTVGVYSVLAMLAFCDGMKCRLARPRHDVCDRFQWVTCSICGPRASILIKCSRTNGTLTVSTESCCGHFFMGMIQPGDARSKTMFVTKPTISPDVHYPSDHPLRKVAKAFLRFNAFHGGDRLLLLSWSDDVGAIHHGVAVRRRIGPLESLLQELPGFFSVQVGPESPVRGLTYRDRQVITLAWLAPWAMDILRIAQYMELDASFRALSPFAYCIPMAVKANVGIPIGIVVAPSERQEMYNLFAATLFRHGLSPDELKNLPLLSDSGSALAAYALIYQPEHYECFRHFLESLGSKTVAALLGRRLLFTLTERQFIEIVEQTMCDFQLACHRGLVTTQGRKRFIKIFHVTMPSSSSDLPTCDVSLFRKQALWGPRGARGVAACSNHVEGMHGQLNKITGRRGSLRNRLCKIIQTLNRGASSWATRVEEARKLAKTRLLERAAGIPQPGSRPERCPKPDVCDQGSIMANRLELPSFPCVHTVTEDLVLPAGPEQFETVGAESTSRVDVEESDGAAWQSVNSAERRRRARNIGVSEDLEAVAGPTDTWQAEFLHSVRNEVSYLKPGADFPYSNYSMGVRFGQIHGALSASVMTPQCAVQQAKSAFFLDCVRAMTDGSWPQ
jgi:hypothetical protein